MHLVRKHWSRRDFLRAAGITGGAVALAPLIPSESQAATAGLKRLLLVQTGNGSILEEWRSNRAGGAFQDGAALPQLQGSILAPLNAHRERLLLLDGIDLTALFESATSGKLTGPNKGHAGSSALWTGINGGGTKFPDDGGAYPTGPSIDQVLNARMGEGRSTAQLAIWNRPPDPRTVYSYDENGTPLPPEANPQVVFDGLFHDGFAKDDLQSSPKRIGERRKHTLSLLRGELQRLEEQWPAGDRDRFERHVEGLDALEARINALANGPTCNVTAENRPIIGKDFRDDVNATTDAHIDNLVYGMACDRVRFASFNLSPENSWVGSSDLSFLDEWSTDHALYDGVHTVSHATNLEATEEKRAQAVKQMANLNRWHSQKLALLLDKLVAAGLMDDTMVVWGTAMSHGGYHSNRNVPFVIAQGSQSPLVSNRYFRWGDFDQPATTAGCNGCNEGGAADTESNNNLLVTLFHAFGQTDVTTFGDPMKVRASGLDDRLMK